jgi:hypothetical protein
MRKYLGRETRGRPGWQHPHHRPFWNVLGLLECLPSKSGALSSNPSTTKERENMEIVCFSQDLTPGIRVSEFIHRTDYLSVRKLLT